MAEVITVSLCFPTRLVIGVIPVKPAHFDSFNCFQHKSTLYKLQFCFLITETLCDESDSFYYRLTELTNIDSAHHLKDKFGQFLYILNVKGKCPWATNAIKEFNLKDSNESTLQFKYLKVMDGNDKLMNMLMR